MAEVVLPRSLVGLFPALPRHLNVEAGTVREVIAVLDAQAPGMADRVLTSGPAIREHINIFVDGELADIDRAVEPSSTVHIIPAVSGG